MRLLILIATLAACRENTEPERAEALFERTAGYGAWAHAPGFAERRPSRTLHGDETLVFVNQTLEMALREERLDAWPPGAIVVKEVFDGGDLDAIAIMEKDEAGWFFAEYDAEGAVLWSGEPELCLHCHRLGSDFLRAVYLPPLRLPER